MYTTKDRLGGVIQVRMHVGLMELPTDYCKYMPETQAAAIKADLNFMFRINSISEAGLVTINVHFKGVEDLDYDYAGRYLGDITVPGSCLARVRCKGDSDWIEYQTMDVDRMVSDVDGNLIFENSQVYLLSLPADYLDDLGYEIDESLAAQYFSQVGKLHTVSRITEWNEVEIDFWHDEVFDLEDGSRLISSSNIVLLGSYFRLMQE